MLARPELGTPEHILLWLAGKDQNETFVWRDHHVCACGQYSREHYGNDCAWLGARWNKDLSLMSSVGGSILSSKSCNDRSITFGELREELVKRWR